MKIKTLHWLFVIQIIIVILICILFFTPSSVLRIILGLPFLLFFPGYALVAVLFVDKAKINHLERIALSVGLSIAIVGLIGFGLNYTPWGIKLEPVLYSIAIFTLIAANIALLRLNTKTKLIQEFNLRLPHWQGSKASKSITIILVIAVLGALGVLGYIIAVPRVSEQFTEFYILGLNGKAQDYPTGFTMEKDQVTHVTYGIGQSDIAGKFGKVTLGIVNHEQQKVVYSLRLTIEDKPSNIYYDGAMVDQIKPIELQQDEKWEHEIGFTPQNIDDNQKVEFLLYKGDEPALENSLRLWIDVK